MASIPPIKRLVKEDFPEVPWIEKLFDALNPFMLSVSNALARNLTHAENFAAVVKSLDVTVPEEEEEEAVPDDAAVAIYALADSAAGQSIPDATYTIIDFDNVVSDDASTIATGASWKFTVPVDCEGKYLVSALVCPNGYAVTRSLRLSVYKNGSEVYQLARTVTAPGIAVGLSGSVVLDLADADYVDLRIYQDTGGAHSLVASAPCTRVSIHQLGFGESAAAPAATTSTEPAACWPMSFSLGDVKAKPTGCQILSVVDRDDAKRAPLATSVSWLPDGDGGVIITNVPGLLPGRKYRIKFLVTTG